MSEPETCQHGVSGPCIVCTPPPTPYGHSGEPYGPAGLTLLTPLVAGMSGHMVGGSPHDAALAEVATLRARVAELTKQIREAEQVLGRALGFRSTSHDDDVYLGAYTLIDLADAAAGRLRMEKE